MIIEIFCLIFIKFSKKFKNINIKIKTKSKTGFSLKLYINSSLNILFYLSSSFTKNGGLNIKLNLYN